MHPSRKPSDASAPFGKAPDFRSVLFCSFKRNVECMKTLPGILLRACLALSLLTSAHGETAAEIFTQGQAAFNKGDLEIAQKHFELVYQLDPHNAQAVAYINRIKASGIGANATNRAKREKELGAVIIPKVEFREATLGTALEYLKQQAAKASPNIAPVSFVLPDDSIKMTPVTISLGQVPLTEVLRYLGDLAGANVTYEQYAVVIRSKKASPATAPQDPTKK